MIFVECKPDAKLVRRLTSLPKRQVVHHKGKYELCKRLEARHNTVGVIDEDPTAAAQPSYLAKLALSEEFEQAGINVFADPARDNRLVVLRPKLEDWVLAAAQECDLDVRNKEIALPNNARRLHRVINANLQKFERLLDALETRNAPRLKALQQLLT